MYNLNKYSGAAQQALLLASFLKTSIFFFNHEDGEYSVKRISDKIVIVNLPKNRILRIFIIVWYLLNKNIKILHLHGFFKHGIILGFLFRKRVILKTTLMDSDDFLTLSKDFNSRLFLRFLLYCVDLNICLTEQLRKINVGFISDLKIKVVPNAVEIPKNISSVKDNVFCFVGLVCERKGTYESIEYFLRHYLSAPGSLMYVIGPVGGIKESDDNYIQKCRELIAAYEAQDRVLFLGNLAKSDVIEYLKISKALIFFSRKEGMPNVVLEAMANNCAPITTGIDGVIDELLDEDTKVNVTVRSYCEGIRLDVIDNVLATKELVHQAEKKFSIDHIARNYMAEYERYLS